MHNNLPNNERKDINKSHSQNTKEFYQHSTLKYNILSEICSEITCNEILDPTVEKFLTEIGDSFINNIIDTSMQFAKHRNSETLNSNDISYAMCKL